MVLRIVALLASLTVLCHSEISHPTSDKIYGKYIELSMNLTILLKDTNIDEAKIHELSKDMVSNDGNEDKIQKILDKFMASLPEDQQKDFGRLYLDKEKLDYITRKVHRVLGYYLTRHQIQRLRDVLDTKFKQGATRPELVEAMVEELTKDVKREKAVKAIELTMKDLKMFNKKNPGLIEKVEVLFGHALVHDEM
ncbi:hypothetical protein GCK72_005321 [Caenorhabditis remanei]|uniref:CRE01735 n=2 Tax=Caenorhabditis remanei TaxID=31234 RepID=A0A6A5HE78_CAERE|nr:hypothetical protein GCK72_005321 [Caenorhabditis remanei]KAF1765369.1 hypothetical protein GCK72_005321 [Caenorhabditis remanei]